MDRSTSPPNPLAVGSASSARRTVRCKFNRACHSATRKPGRHESSRTRARSSSLHAPPLTPPPSYGLRLPRRSQGEPAAQAAPGPQATRLDSPLLPGATPLPALLRCVRLQAARLLKLHHTKKLDLTPPPEAQLWTRRLHSSANSPRASAIG